MLALTAATFLMAAPTANAGSQVPFKAVFNTEAESTVNFPIASVYVVGEGQATHLGQTLTETTDQSVNLLTGEGTATYHFVAANGDRIRARFVFTTTPLPTQPGLPCPAPGRSLAELAASQAHQALAPLRGP